MLGRVGLRSARRLRPQTKLNMASPLNDPKKAEVARANFKEAGLGDFIELREGDLRQTLQDVGGPVDFMLVDI